MEGYANVNSNHEDYDDLNIESRNSTSDDWKKKDDVKQESWRDLERRVLSLQVPLDDGTGQGYVFSFKLVGGVQRWRCHLCDILVIGSRHVDTHIQSKKHQVKLALPSHPRNLFTRIEPRDRTAVEVPALAPGEPVPPGFEDVVRRVAQIQATLDAHRGSPLIGLEYMVELTPEERGKEPMYVCMLCDKKGDPRVAMAHMLSFNHRSKYIGIHFPTASKLIATEFQARKDSKKVVHLALNHLCSKVEERFGRLQPLVVEKDTFDRQRDQIKTQIDQDPHFSETAGDTLVDLLDRKIIDALVEEEEKKEAEPPKPDPAPVTVFNRGKISCDRSRLRGRSEEDNALEEENVFKKLAEMEKKATEALKEKEKEKAINESKKGESMGTKKDPLASADTKSLSSISSISSSSLSLSRSKSPASRSRSRSPVPRGPRHPFVIRERDRNRDRDRDRNRDRERFRERERERPRWPSAGRRVPLRRTRSRSHSRRTRSRSRTRSPASRRRPRLRSRSPRRRSPPSPSYRKKGSSPVRGSGTSGTTTAAGSAGSAGGANGERRARENERSRWLKFREEADRIDRDMIDKLKFHEKNPEKHPMYPEEWKKFWNRRYKELQGEGKDPAKHDFKPEWIEYWNRRMREMYDEELKSKKDEWRVRLGLPEEGEEPRSQPIVRKRKLPSSLDKGTADDGDFGDDVIVLSPTPTKEEKQSGKDVTVADIKNTWKALTGSDIKDSGGSERRSPSPWEDTDYPKRIPSGSGETSPSRGNGKWWQNSRGSHSSRGRPVRTGGGPRVYEPSNGPGGIVNSLRMLTALESQLGSLGPQVNALLPKALALEKMAIDSSEQLLADPSNFALFETCREKLKGQLFAGIVERNMVMATRTVVQGINMLLAKADIGPSPSAVAAAVVSSITPVSSLTPVSSVVGVVPPLASPVTPTLLLPVSTVPPSEPVIVPGIGTMDKVAIAQQIAEALVLQGKTDVSQGELETLINAVVGMAQASAASQEPISAAAYARQQGQQLPTASPVTQIQTPLTIDTNISSDKVSSLAGGESPFTQLLSSVTKQAGSGHSKNNSRPTALQILQSAYNESSRNGAGDNSKTGAFSSRPEKMDDLSEEDLKTLLLNFKELPSEEQYGLISYLKKVEAKEPTRVERLRQFVNVGHLVKSPKKESVVARKQPNMKADSSFQNKLQELKSLHGNDRSSSSNTGRLSPFSLREGGINPSGEERPSKVDHESSKTKLDASDDDDDDYSFEDIYAAASRKVKEREKAIAEETAKLEKEEKKKEKTPDDPRVLLRETKAIIANLMGQLPAKFIQKQSPVKESPATPRKTEQSSSVFPEGSSFLNNSKPPMFNLENLKQSVEREAGLHPSSTPLENNPYYPNFMDTNAPGDYGSQYPNQYPDQGYSEQPIQQNYPQSGYEATYSDSGYYSNIQQQQPIQNQPLPLPQQNFPPQQYNQNPYNSGFSEPGMVDPGNQYQQSYQPPAQSYPTGYGQYSGQQGYY